MPESVPFTYWVGMQTPADASREALEEFNAFYTDVHVGEVVERHGFLRATRYELQEPDPRGDFGPRWLAVYEMDEQAANGYLKRNGAPPRGGRAYTPGPPLWRQAEIAWRMFWRPLAVVGKESDAAHESIFCVGMNVPPDTDAQALDDFNRFYTDIHVPEVMERRAFARGVRYELFREYKHPAPGSPRFCAVYQTLPNAKQPEPPTAPMSSGPPAWEQHDTLWRLTYHRIAQ